MKSDILELNDFKTRRVQMFRKSLVELTELQIKHAKVNIDRERSFSSQMEISRLKFK